MWTSLVAQMVKNLPTMQETRVRFLGQEDPLVKEMATHSSILAWRIPWTEEPCRLQSMGCMVWRVIPGPLSKRKRRLDSLEAAQGAPRDPRRD